MFAGRYFAARYFAPRYFPEVGAVLITVRRTLMLLGIGS